MKSKIYLVIAIIIFILAGTLSVYIGKFHDEKRDNARLAENLKEQMDINTDQVTLNLKDKEVIGELRKEKDRLAAELKIKPKQIEKIVVIDNSTHDTIRVEVPVIIAGENTWKISDTTECFKWAGIALKEGDSLRVVRTLFEYDNEITQTFYRERPKKFLFIKYGKWEFKQKIDSKCGKSSVSTFNFIK